MDSFRVSVDIQARFRDTDAMGHVNNAVYLSYLELARMHYWTALTGQRGYNGADFIVARVEIDYRSQTMPGEDLRAWVRICELRRSSFMFDYRLENKETGRLVAEGRTVQACYDYAKRKVKRLDPDLRAKVLAFEAPGTVTIPA